MFDLLIKVNGMKKSVVTTREVMFFTGESKNSVSRRLNCLVDRGFLKRTIVYKRGKFVTYKLYKGVINDFIKNYYYD